MKDFLKIMKWYDWVLVVIMIVSPIVVNCLILNISVGAKIYGSEDGWLGFFGMLIGCFAPLYMLFRTRMWNQEDNKETRQMQYEILQYNAEKECFQKIKEQLERNFQAIDFQSLAEACAQMNAENYNFALSILLQLNRQVEMRGYSSDLYFDLNNPAPEEKQYLEAYGYVLGVYGVYVNDMMLICQIYQMSRMAHSNVDVVEKVKGLVQVYDMLQEREKKIANLPESAIIPKLKNLAQRGLERADYPSTVEFICQTRLEESFRVHEEKFQIIDATRRLQHYYEQVLQKRRQDIVYPIPSKKVGTFRQWEDRKVVDTKL